MALSIHLLIREKVENCCDKADGTIISKANDIYMTSFDRR